MRIESWVGVTAVLLLMFGGVDRRRQQQCRRSPLPANVELLHDIERAIRFIYDGRRPSALNARASRARTTCASPCGLIRRSRAAAARSRSSSGGAGTFAPTCICRQARTTSELLAHEFEHILEQIEGLDLRRLARVKGSGVHEVEYAVFETDRAQAAGRVVAAETGRRRARRRRIDIRFIREHG